MKSDPLTRFGLRRYLAVAWIFLAGALGAAQETSRASIRLSVERATWRGGRCDLESLQLACGEAELRADRGTFLWSGDAQSEMRLELRDAVGAKCPLDLLPLPANCPSSRLEWRAERFGFTLDGRRHLRDLHCAPLSLEVIASNSMPLEPWARVAAEDLKLNSQGAGAINHCHFRVDPIPPLADLPTAMLGYLRGHCHRLEWDSESMRCAERLDLIWSKGEVRHRGLIEARWTGEARSLKGSGSMHGRWFAQAHCEGRLAIEGPYHFGWQHQQLQLQALENGAINLTWTEPKRRIALSGQRAQLALARSTERQPEGRLEGEVRLCCREERGGNPARHAIQAQWLAIGPRRLTFGSPAAGALVYTDEASGLEVRAQTLHAEIPHGAGWRIRSEGQVRARMPADARLQRLPRKPLGKYAG